MTEFEKIYKEYFSDVFLYIKSISGNEHIAEDVTAEAFFRAMESLDSFNGKCDVRVWLCQIAKNCYFSYLRKNKRIVPVETKVTDERTTDMDLERSIVNSEMSLKAHEILHSLPEPYKEVFTLRIFGELNFKKIAKLFGKTENWACVTFHRAKNMIRERMEDYQ